MAELGTGLQKGTVCCRDGVTFICGWGSNKVWVACSSNESLDRDELSAGVTLLEVCAYTPGEEEDPPRSSITVQDDWSLLVSVDDGAGNMATYVCANTADGFEEK